MMTLKYPEPAVRPQEVPSQGAGLFTLPQGTATISKTDAQALKTLCDTLRERLLGRVVLTAHPHRIGSRTGVALHLEGRLGQSVDVLVTVTGTTS